MTTAPVTSTLGIAREILTPIVGGVAGFFAAHGLSLTSDQQATAVTLAATGAVALERWIMRLITPQPLPPPQPPAPTPPPSTKS